MSTLVFRSMKEKIFGPYIIEIQPDEISLQVPKERSPLDTRFLTQFYCETFCRLAEQLADSQRQAKPAAKG